MNFYQEVYRIVKKVPKGKVVTYGQVAAKISTPRAARAVGYALRALPEGSTVPWWRVINSKGIISIQNMQHPAEEQVSRLKKDGIKIFQKKSQYYVDLETCLYRL